MFSDKGKVSVAGCEQDDFSLQRQSVISLTLRTSSKQEENFVEYFLARAFCLYNKRCANVFLDAMRFLHLTTRLALLNDWPI